MDYVQVRILSWPHKDPPLIMGDFLFTHIFITMNLQEHIRRVLKESKFFHRRIDLDEVKWLLSINAEQIFHETKSFKQFKYEVTLRAVESIMWNEHGIGWADLPEQEEIDFVTKVSDMFEYMIIDLYKHIRGKL